MKASLVISPVTKNGKPAFVVNIPAGVSGGTRKRKFFKKLTAAETFVRKWKSEVSDYGTLWTALSERQRTGILYHVQRLAEAGWSLGDATDHIIKHGKAPPSMILGTVAEQFLQAKEAKACRPRYLAKLKGSVSLFLAGRRERPIAEITLPDIEEYLNRNGWAGATRRTHWIDIRSLFSFAVKRGYCRENVASQVEAPILDDKPPGVLTVAQCAALLDACQRRRPEVLSWLTLCLFAGVRVEEALRLTADAIQPDHILISALKAKTRRRRLVEITPQIRAWLDAAKPHGKKLIPSNWRKCFAEVRRAAGLWQEWPQNAIRHSFISYHVAKYRNENEAAQIAGTSPAMIYKHYRELVRPKEAEEFFGLLPDAAALEEGARVTAGRAEASHAARVASGKRTGELNRKRAQEGIATDVLAGPVVTRWRTNGSTQSPDD